MALLIEDRRANAAVVWTLVALLALFVGYSLFVGELLWGGFGVLAAAIIGAPAAVAGDPKYLPDWTVVLFVVAPFGVGALFETGSAPVYVVLAGLALLMAVEIDAFSTAAFVPWFAVAFVVLTSMSLAAIWGIAQYFADLYLGTDYILGKADLMWDLVAATAISVGAGVLFELVFRERDATAASGGDAA